MTVDGNDVLAVYETTKEAVERARAGGGVTLIEILTYRRKGHAEHDDQRYQPDAEIAEWAEKNDPVRRYADKLLESRWASRDELDAITERVDQELARIVTDCENDPAPASDERALDQVIAFPAQADRLWFRRLNA